MWDKYCSRAGPDVLRSEDCSGRTGPYKYVMGVVLVVGPWGLDEWANWRELSK